MFITFTPYASNYGLSYSFREVPKLIMSNFSTTTFPIIKSSYNNLLTVNSSMNSSNITTIVNSNSNESLLSLFLLILLFFVLLYYRIESLITSRIRIVINDKNNVDYVTTIVNYMTRLPSIRDLVFNGNFYVSYDQGEFRITTGIYGKFRMIDDDCVLEITSNTLSSRELRRFLDKIYIDSKIGDRQQYLYTARPSRNSAIRFEKTPFRTELSLDHMKTTELEPVIKQVEFYINNREWYEKMGFPYTLGVLVYGPSGCGKTSFIKATAKDCGRQIITITLDKQTTYKQLQSLFFDEMIYVYHPVTKKSVTQFVPFHQRMYVFENIDKITMKQYSMLKELLYGLLETPERFIVFTATDIKSIDPSLFAAGRIDAKVYLDYCSVETIKEMFLNFYEVDEENVEFGDSLRDNVLTPSVVYEIMFKNITDRDGALKELYERCNVDIVEASLDDTINDELQEEVESMISEELSEEKDIDITETKEKIIDMTSSSELEPEEVKEVKEIELVDFRNSKVIESPIKELEKVEEIKEIKEDKPLTVEEKIELMETLNNEMPNLSDIEKNIDCEITDSDFSEESPLNELSQSDFLKGISVISSTSERKSVILDDFFKSTDVKRK